MKSNANPAARTVVANKWCSSQVVTSVWNHCVHVRLYVDLSSITTTPNFIIPGNFVVGATGVLHVRSGKHTSFSFDNILQFVLSFMQ